MKTLKIIFGIFLLILFSGKVKAQDKKYEKDAQASQLMEFTRESLSIQQQSPAANSNNTLFIQQIGESNLIRANIHTSSSDVNYFQNGEDNRINTQVNAKTYRSTIAQNGSNNKIFDWVYAPTKEIELNLSQNGKDHTFVRFGSNSIGDKLQFTMNGNSNSIIVRNFK